MKSRCIKAGLVVLGLWLVCVLASGDRSFRTAAGFSPCDFGAQHHLSFKELTAFPHGYYEYSMSPAEFQEMKKYLGDWRIQQRLILMYPDSPIDLENAWYCLHATDNCDCWLVYDEDRQVLYAGYCRH